MTPDRPGFYFYPKDWIWDLQLRQCSPAARGLWVDLLCLMHEGETYGHLATPLDLVLRITGFREREYKALLAELEGKKVVKRNGDGVLFSKRMVEDEADRATRAANGVKGGRPRKVTSDAPQASGSAWEEFRKLYPSHRFDEQMACQMFISRADDAAILAGLKRAVASDDWRKDEGRFVPWASKFIAEGKYAGFKAAEAAASPYVKYKPPE